ncbi:putative membrane protein YdfJ with MMPL/SSD domain [Streptomyces sp. V4I23]|uniref:MMPL family transporter n=1 Tax=Streptomyces sp. V4I23 TaxID=3042282 RepID=UPI002782CC97|nr:MMPL family transporter [Streptomyces sp. V4I23]MDQ1006289.1 putative membrane protein YdfJ with MMPL/SSD domain [Streptomyces sp. V4I23]
MLVRHRSAICVPVLMFCITFGLAMDYSVLLLARIKEEYTATGDNTRAVAFGMERSGRLITAAALIVTTVLGAMATSEPAVLKLLGVGLALAVLVDATIVRGLLVPAAMRLLGHRNWWASRPLRRLHARIGLRDDRHRRAPAGGAPGRPREKRRPRPPGARPTSRDDRVRRSRSVPRPGGRRGAG